METITDGGIAKDDTYIHLNFVCWQYKSVANVFKGFTFIAISNLEIFHLSLILSCFLCFLYLFLHVNFLRYHWFLQEDM